jgi:hypothetical protein
MCSLAVWRLEPLAVRSRRAKSGLLRSPTGDRDHLTRQEVAGFGGQGQRQLGGFGTLAGPARWDVRDKLPTNS